MLYCMVRKFGFSSSSYVLLAEVDFDDFLISLGFLKEQWGLETATPTLYCSPPAF